MIIMSVAAGNRSRSFTLHREACPFPGGQARGHDVETFVPELSKNERDLLSHVSVRAAAVQYDTTFLREKRLDDWEALLHLGRGQ